MTAAELLGEQECSWIEWETLFNNGGRKNRSKIVPE